jgi:hypothetical protein
MQERVWHDFHVWLHGTSKDLLLRAETEAMHTDPRLACPLVRAS